VLEILSGVLFHFMRSKKAVEFVAGSNAEQRLELILAQAPLPIGLDCESLECGSGRVRARRYRAEASSSGISSLICMSHFSNRFIIPEVLRRFHYAMRPAADVIWANARTVAAMSITDRSFPDSRRRRAVIITADDFGSSREVNAAVISTFQHGVLTAASLMVAGAARDEAVSFARELPDLDVGLHLVVCRGLSVLGPKHLDGIVDALGRFRQQPILAGLKYFFDRRVRSCLRDELRAQIDSHLDLVGYLNHIDGHLNFHVHPVIAAILIELASEYRIPFMRLPREPLLTTLGLARDHLTRKIIESIIFRTLSRRTFKIMRAHGIRTTDRLFGLHQTGHLSQAYIVGLIARLPVGTTEIYFHPAEAVGAIPPPAAARTEAQILKSSRVRQALIEAGARLTSFAEVARTHT
jgi:chitin disaccharide deacetylase